MHSGDLESRLEPESVVRRLVEEVMIQRRLEVLDELYDDGSRGCWRCTSSPRNSPH